MFGVIVCRNSINLGDEIQSIAAIQQLKNNGVVVDFYYDRDIGDLYSYKTHEKMTIDPTVQYNLICSSWFDGNYCKWPLPSYINPLFISFHVNETVKDKSYEWLNTYQRNFSSLTDIKYKNFYGNQPIGCRDEHTHQKFLSSGYDQSYVSGCLTTTLTIPTLSIPRKGIFLVDVHPSLISQYVPTAILEKAQLVSHVFKGSPTNEIDKYQEAQKLLELYQSAELVITSRLHCALPCLSYNTPVLFHFHDMDDVRLKGLIDTIPVIGRDEIDYTNIYNILPIYWEDRVTRMKNTVAEWVMSIKDS